MLDFAAYAMYEQLARANAASWRIGARHFMQEETPLVMATQCRLFTEPPPAQSATHLSCTNINQKKSFTALLVGGKIHGRLITKHFNINNFLGVRKS